MEVEQLLVIAMLCSFVLLLFSGFPVAWVLAGVGVLFTGVGWLADRYLGAATGIDYQTLGLVPGRIFSIMNNWVLVAIPMFVLMGLVLQKSSVTERLLLSMQQVFGQIRGGLALSVTLVGIVLAASTGIIGASVVMLGIISLPLMLRQGYAPSFALGTIASAGCLGILIPPSIMLVVMGDQLAVSVGDLFMGAVFPGLLLGALYAAYILFSAWLQPGKAPLSRDQDRFSIALIASLLRDVLPTGLLILLVLGSIFAGVATVTEASAVGVFGALLLAAAYRRLDRDMLGSVLSETMMTVGYIFAIFVGATVFSLVLRELGGDQLIESALTGIPLDATGVVLVIVLLVFLLGFLLDWIEISLILLPLLAPVITSMDLSVPGYGVLDQPQLIWFGLVIAMTLQTSFLTPPVGFALFYLKGVCPADVSLLQIYKGVMPFIGLQLLALLMVIFFPEIVTWLPAQVYR